MHAGSWTYAINFFLAIRVCSFVTVAVAAGVSLVDADTGLLSLCSRRVTCLEKLRTSGNMNLLRLRGSPFATQRD